MGLVMLLMVWWSSHAHAIGVLMLSTMLLVLHAMYYAGSVLNALYCMLLLYCWCGVSLVLYAVVYLLLVGLLVSWYLYL